MYHRVTIHVGMVVLCLPDVCNTEANEKLTDCPVVTLNPWVYPMPWCVQLLWGFLGFEAKMFLLINQTNSAVLKCFLAFFLSI